jgi:hypothetical protein
MMENFLTPAAAEVLAGLPETIVQVDHELRIAHVNRPESPVFRSKASSGDLIRDVIDPEATEVVVGMIDNAQRTGCVQRRYLIAIMRGTGYCLNSTWVWSMFIQSRITCC